MNHSDGSKKYLDTLSRLPEFGEKILGEIAKKVLILMVSSIDPWRDFC